MTSKMVPWYQFWQRCCLMFCMLNLNIAQYCVQNSKNGSSAGEGNRTLVKKDLSALGIKKNNNYNWKCHPPNQFAMDAIKRAKTAECRNQINRVSSDIQEFANDEVKVARNCGLDSHTTQTYMGCFPMHQFKDMLVEPKLSKDSDAALQCTDICIQLGFPVSGVRCNTECLCANTGDINTNAYLPNTFCTSVHCMKTAGKPVSTYETGLIKQNRRTDWRIPSPDTNLHKDGLYRGPKIVFFLMLNGRSSRQVQRMLKLIYRPWHFYYVHVDFRADFMYSQFAKLKETYGAENFKIAENRFKVTEGAPSSLQMVTESLKDILDTWSDWDFVLNLSESDFPLLPLKDLEAVLGENLGLNFLYNLGEESRSLIKNLHADFAFVDCEERIWKVGRRKMPRGLQIDAGSEWFILSRKLANYATKSADILVTSLLNHFSASFVPLKFYFHSIAANSEFCGSVINDDFRYQNIPSLKDCQCQSTISDVCTCAAQRLGVDDWKKLNKTGEKPEKWKFFGRKFESLIDQTVVARAENESSTVPIETDEVYESYWQNEYHVSDKHAKVDQSLIVFMKAVGQVAYHNLYLYQSIPNDCKLGRPAELTYYKAHDKAPIDLLVKLPIKCNDRKTKDHIEILVRKKIIWEVKSKVTELKIHDMEVNHNFDVTIGGFRNFHGVLGQTNQDPTLCYNVTTYPLHNPSSHVITKVAWIGPPGNGPDYLEAGKQALTPNTIANYFSILNLLSLKGYKMRPGKWTARLLANEVLNLAEASFPVFPGETNDMDLAESLVKEFYDVQEVCKILGKDTDLTIPLLRDCGTVKWSSAYPDKKSDFNFQWSNGTTSENIKSIKI